MESVFKIWTINRNLYLDFLEKYTLEQLNKIPEGFSNNLIWNIGHIIVAQQRLVYTASNLSINIPIELVNSYKSGTKPSTTDTQATVDIFKNLLLSLVAETKADFESGKFVSYNEFTTSTGFQLSTSIDAINFNNYHEALHLGFMMNIRKFV